FRLGGDEFSLVLPQTDFAQALEIAKRIGVVFSEVLHSLQISVDVSVDHGVATLMVDGDQADQLIRVADERLYQLKHSNRVRSTVEFEPTKPRELAHAPAKPQQEVAPIPREAAPETPPSISNAQPVREPLQPEGHAAIKVPEMPRPAQPSESSPGAAVSASDTPAPTALPIDGARMQPRPDYSVQRKSERVS